MRAPVERDRALNIALADPDERILRAAVKEARTRYNEIAVPIITRRLQDDLPADLRTQLVRLLENTQSSNALDALARIVAPTRSFLGKPRLASSSPVMLAALNVLANFWSTEPRAAAILSRALKSQEPEVRAAAVGKASK
jgi:HEAT repeat protein